jgi:CRP-like cAMP-binding protein
LNQGDNSSPILVVRKGLLGMFYYDAKGNDITHWFTTEMSIIIDPATYFDQVPSNYLIEVLEDCNVCSLDLKELNRLCEEHH